MRLVGLGLALALAAAPAATQPPGATQPLAAGEVLLELGAIGTATAPADLATLDIAFGGTGATEAAARANVDARFGRIVAAARRAGVPAAAITRRDAPPLLIAAVAQMPQPQPPGEQAMRAEPYQTYGYASVRITDMARVESIRAALAAVENEYGNAAPTYSLTDSRAARQTARTQALAAVRADAEAYAGALGMRVARIVRVSERTGVGMLPYLLGDPTIPRRLFGPAENQNPNVTVLVVVGVDFALAPR